MGVVVGDGGAGRRGPGQRVVHRLRDPVVHAGDACELGGRLPLLGARGEPARLQRRRAGPRVADRRFLGVAGTPTVLAERALGR